MANTYTLIASSTVGAGGAANIEFTSIPATYTDLLVKVSARDNGSRTETNIRITFNNVGGTSYSGKLLYGSGSAAFSYSQSSAAYLAQQYANASGSTANTFCNLEFYIPNYTSSNNKSVSIDSVVETNATGSSMGLSAGLFSNSAAITSIKLVSDNPANVYSQYSTAYLYGIKNS